MRLIDADAQYKQYQEICMGIECMKCPFLDLQDGCKVENLILNSPTIETDEYIRGYTQAEYDIFHGGNYTPIKHGRWVGIDDFPHEVWECDKCGKIVETDEPPNYCENCGARMDEVEE